MKKLILTATIAALVLSGCAVKKQYGASGGSKADGIVRMSYTYGAFEIPTVDEAGSLQQAIRRCELWGYDGAESFDFTEKKCQQYSSDLGCVSWLVTKEFQCN